MNSLAIPLFRPEVIHHPQGPVQHLYRLDNGFGVSACRGTGNYCDRNTWELAVLSFHPIDRRELPWVLCYHTPAAGDVRGWLTDDEVNQILATVSLFPDWHRCSGRSRWQDQHEPWDAEEDPWDLPWAQPLPIEA